MIGGVARALGGAVNEGVVNLKCTVKNIEQDKNYYPNKPNIGKVIVYKIVQGQNVTVINDAGLIEVDLGKITLNKFKT